MTLICGLYLMRVASYHCQSFHVQIPKILSNS